MAMINKKSSKISVDFSGVESGGGRKIPEGEYLIKVAEVELKTSQAGNPYLGFKYKVANGPFSGAVIYDNISLQPQALWRFRTLLECFGLTPPDGKLDLDLSKLVGKTVFVEISNENYQGKEKPRIVNILAGGQETTSTNSSVEIGFKINDMVKFTSDAIDYNGRIVQIEGTSCHVEVDGDEWEIELSELTKG